MSSVPPPPQPPANVPPTGGASPDAGAALAYGWKKFQENVGGLLAVILIPLVAQLILSAVGAVFDSIVMQLLLSAVSYVVSLMLAIGIFNAALMITSGQRVDVGQAFSSDRWGEWILFSFVFGLMVGIGVLFCLVGALVVLAFFGLAPYYFLDQRMGLGDSLSASLEKTRSTSGLPMAIALTVLVGALGVILCIIGLFVTMPIAYVGVAFLYRHVNNQPVAP
ncbi:MAG: hypothetical protein ACRDV7_03965 [Acidimicrobiia bacterium]